MSLAARFALAAFVPSCLALGLSLTGCSGSPEPRQSPQTPSITTITSFPPDLGHGAPRLESEDTMLYTPVEVRQRCAGLDPRFAFNSSRLEGSDTAGLVALARCMQNGPLAGKVVTLVGHADTRGSQPLNDRLGEKRAEAVKLFLMKSGIDADRVVTVTRGKDDAHPIPQDWDRRVDIEILP